MIRLIFIIAGVILLLMAGFNVSAPRFAPGWFGLALLAVVAFADTLSQSA